MRTIHKYLISRDNAIVTLKMPHGATPLHGEWQSGSHKDADGEWKLGALCLWAEVNDIEEQTERKFIFVGTGHQIPPNAKHVNSFVMQQARLVFHVYEVFS